MGLLMNPFSDNEVLSASQKCEFFITLQNCILGKFAFNTNRIFQNGKQKRFLVKSFVRV